MAILDANMATVLKNTEYWFWYWKCENGFL